MIQQKYRLELRRNGVLQKTVVDLTHYQARMLKRGYRAKGFETIILKAKRYGSQLDDNGPSSPTPRDQGTGAREGGSGQDNFDSDSPTAPDPFR